MDDQDKSEQLFREFLRRRESGEDMDPEEFLRQHPEFEKDPPQRFVESLRRVKENRAKVIIP